ncbi:MAG: alpha-glucan family phosphorylase, partial [Deltaproteobacteria bacterium]|nr:alpha-glucan family phosphorylase [Deltaproteobacteria bacterium]
MQGTVDSKIAYFCMEYGLDESLPIYSGGLGVLAGDIMKAARDSDTNLIGVGVMWDEGYTVQRTDDQGHVYDTWEKTPRTSLRELDVSIEVQIGEESVGLNAFEVEGFGNTQLYLLEPKLEKHRDMTRRLYNGQGKMRIAQEMILGIGGVRLLRALEIPVELYHFNEGHALFAGFELIREKMHEGLSFGQALTASRSEVVFTTHTPVKAGNEIHAMSDLLEQGVGLGVLGETELTNLGGNPFEMTVAALRLSRKANAVAKLHGQTAAQMWAHVEGGAEIIPITNGIHLPSWQDKRVADWMPTREPGALWDITRDLKKELIAYIQQKTGQTLADDKLLIGFARRAATYKRADLILED